jgi:two-component system response regulator
MNVMPHTILLVEDNPDHALVVLDALDLAPENVTVEIARDGGEALDYLFSEEHPMPALVLLDVKLPVADGFEVLERIKSDERLRVIPVVMLTTTSDGRDVARCYELGTNSFVSKPVDAAELRDRIAQIPSYWLDVNTVPTVPAVPQS